MLKRITRKTMVSLATVLVVLAVALFDVVLNPSKEGSLSEGFHVARGVDGDTIELEGGQKVRYIGIDTPNVS